MALDAAHRASIYEKFRPILGDEDANALMSEFPAVEAQELVTKDFLRAELSELRAELRAELHSGISGVRAEIADVRGEIAELKSWMLLRLGSAIAAATAIQITAMGLLT